MAEAKRDENSVPTLLGVSSVDGVTPVVLWADPTTHRLLTDAASGMTNPMTTGGDIIYGGVAGAPTRLANGTAGQVLQSNGTTLAPSWVAAGTGNVTKVGTPVNDQVGVWTGDGTLGGDADLIFDGTNLGIGANIPTHALTLPNASTGIALYNTADQVTNYERALMYWSGNVFNILTTKGGTGVKRNITIDGGDTRILADDQLYLQSDTTNKNIEFGTGATGLNLFLNRSSYTDASGVEDMTYMAPTANQSGTAGYNALRVSVTETATGSGVKNLILAQVGGIDKLSVANTGITTITNTTNSASNQVLVLQGDRATPTAADNIYQSFLLSDSTGVQTEFARISAVASVVTNTSEQGRLWFHIQENGTLTNKLVLSQSFLFPNTNDTLGLGQGANAFSDLFLADGGVINFNNGNATLTHSTGLLTSSVPLSLGTSNALTAGTIELGHASANTLSASGGVLSIEGVVIPSISSTNTITNKRNQARTASSTTSANLSPDLSTANVYFRTTQTATLTIIIAILQK